MTTTSNPFARVDDLRNQHTQMASELKEINGKIERKEGDRSGLVQRGENLARGLLKLDDAIKAADADLQAQVFDGIKNSRYGLESGDGSPVDYLGLTGRGPTGQADSITSRLVAALKASRFDPKTNPTVTLDGSRLFAAKAGTGGLKAQTLPTFADWNRGAPSVVPMGQDSRFMWRAMVSDNLPIDETSVQDFKITTATVTGDIERAPSAVTDKADLATTTTLVNEAVRQFAITIDDIPNQLFASVPMLEAYLLARAEFQLEDALDTHVLAQIVAATPPFGNTGTGLIAKVRSAITTMRATGASPSLLVVNPTDSETLDTYTTADGIFLLTDPATSPGGNGPVWNLRRVERIGTGAEAPYVIDPAMLGVLYLGAMQVAADPYTGFKKNTTTLRLEFNALMHVRNANGARRIAAA